MNQSTKLLKGIVCVVWLLVLVFGVSFLSENFFEESSFLIAEQKKEEQNKDEKKKDRAEEKEEIPKEEVISQNEKHAYLTFDDGPSDNTDRILDILKEKGVKATFFVVGKTDDRSKERYKRILREGHTLGMHSYSHDYDLIYGSLKGYKEDLMKLQDYLYEVTGERIRIYRFPGGSSNHVSKIPIQSCINFLDKMGIIYYDWNASSEDAVSIGTSCSKLNQNILKDALLYKDTVILMHDLHECHTTVEGLEPLIDRLLEEGYLLRPITQDTIPVQHVKDSKKKEIGRQEGKSLPVFSV